METREIKVDRFVAIINCTPCEGRFSCHIPAYDIIFSSKEEDIERKGIAMMKSFIEFYNIK